MSQYFIYCRKSSESEERQVLSIESQIKELEELCDRQKLIAAEMLTESKSAKAPGRPVFNDLMKKVYRGEVKGIICWKLDRLARNPIDGSALVWALDQGKLAEIVTAHGSFKNNSNDKFLMQIEFGMAKKYVDDLSDNVRRGNRAKLEKGWVPCRPPLGYLNEPRERTIVRDPERFSLVQKMWQLLLHGTAPREVLRQASEEWGLRTRVSRRSGGGPLSHSAFYALFANPFYYGQIENRAGIFPGKHEKMISEAEYWKVQEILGRKGRPRPKTHQFAFTGLIHCGSCGGMITAEEKINHYGYHYVYYHCTKKDRQNPCREKYVNASDLEKQIGEFLSRIQVPDRLLQVGIEYLEQENLHDYEQDQAIKTSLQQSIANTKTKLASLNQMRLNDLIDDVEYLFEKKILLKEKRRLEQSLENSSRTRQAAAERAREVLNFGHTALKSFQNGSLDGKRTILTNIGSNFSITDKILSIQAEKPFVILENGLKAILGNSDPFEPSDSGYSKVIFDLSDSMILQWCALVDEVRTYFLEHSSNTTDQSNDEFPSAF